MFRRSLLCLAAASLALAALSLLPFRITAQKKDAPRVMNWILYD